MKIVVSTLSDVLSDHYNSPFLIAVHFYVIKTLIFAIVN